MGALDSIPSYHSFHQCSVYSRNPRFRRTKSHSTCFVLWIERDQYHLKSPSDPSVRIIGPVLGFEGANGEPEQQSVYHDNR